MGLLVTWQQSDVDNTYNTYDRSMSIFPRFHMGGSNHGSEALISGVQTQKVKRIFDISKPGSADSDEGP